MDNSILRPLPAAPPPPLARVERAEVYVALTVDMSGSMKPVATAVVRMIRDFVFEQRRALMTADLSLSFFADTITPVFSGPIHRAPMALDYTPFGGTALLDALGWTIAFGRAAARKRTTIAVITDGAECSSQEYTPAKIRELVEQALRDEWQILFLATDQAALRAAKEWGIPASCCTVHGGNAGTYSNMARVLTGAVEAHATGKRIGFTDGQRRLLEHWA